MIKIIVLILQPENNDYSDSNNESSEVTDSESPLPADEGGEVPPWLAPKEPESITASIEDFETTPESDTLGEETKETESDAKEEETKETESDAKEKTDAIIEIIEATTEDSSDSQVETTPVSGEAEDLTSEKENEKEATQEATEESPIATSAGSDEGETEASFITASLPPLVDENFITDAPMDEDKKTSVNAIDDSTIITTVKVSNENDGNTDMSDEGSGITITVGIFNETVCLAGDLLCEAICAKKCNNVKECEDGSDEKDCETTIGTNIYFN